MGWGGLPSAPDIHPETATFLSGFWGRACLTEGEPLPEATLAKYATVQKEEKIQLLQNLQELERTDRITSLQTGLNQKVQPGSPAQN